MTRERLESLYESEEILDAASLKGVKLEAKVDGKTPLEYCLGIFDERAVGDDADECVCGSYEMHLNVIALLEAGAVQTAKAKKTLKTIESIATSVAMGHNPRYDHLGAHEEIDAVLACAEKMSSAKAAKRAAPAGDARFGTKKTKKTVSKVDNKYASRTAAQLLRLRDEFDTVESFEMESAVVGE